MTYQLITQDAALAEACEYFSRCEHISVDTEFKRETSYYPKPCLIQIAGNNRTVCIDPFEITDFSPLKTLLCNEKVTKVFHAARQDMEVFQILVDCLPTPVFDTQIAAALLGETHQIGYSALVKAFFDIELDKTLTRTDWEKRPLSEKELNYAANDVEYLEKIFETQKQQLIEKKRMPWLEEEVSTLFHDNVYVDSLIKVWKKISRSAKFSQEQRNILYALNQWREQEASQRDRARQFVISNDVLVELALKQPKNLNELKQVDNIPNPVLNRYSDELLKIINSDETQQFDIPEEETRYQLTPEEKSILKKMKAELHRTAEDLKIEESLLCNRKSLEQLIRSEPQNKLLNGWRYEIIGQKLEKILRDNEQRY